MRNWIFLLPILFVVHGCSVWTRGGSDRSHSAARRDDDAARRARERRRWKRLVEILDHYDEVAKVTADFETRAFLPDGMVHTEKGTFEYSKGESKWTYLDDQGRVVKEVQCKEDRIVLRTFKYRRRGRKPRIREQEIQARYGCVLQALVHYTGALQKNRLEKDGKVIIVHDFDEERGTVNKVTLMKNGMTTEIVFKNVQFVPEGTDSHHPSDATATPEQEAPGTEENK